MWEPDVRRPVIVLRREPHAGDWRLCAAERCDAIAAWLGRDADPVEMYAAAQCDGRPQE